MKKTGIIVGTILGVAGIAGAGYALSNGRVRRKIYRKSKRMMENVGDAFDRVRG